MRVVDDRDGLRDLMEKQYAPPSVIGDKGYIGEKFFIVFPRIFTILLMDKVYQDYDYLPSELFQGVFIIGVPHDDCRQKGGKQMRIFRGTAYLNTRCSTCPSPKKKMNYTK